MKSFGTVILALAAAAPIAAAADGLEASRTGVTFGGAAAHHRPKDADHGEYYGLAQLRLHVTPVVALEGSAGYRENSFGGGPVYVTAVQVSVLAYLTPALRVSPYLLGGGGWYHGRVHEVATAARYGTHAGVGLEAALSRRWTADASWRYLWNQDVVKPTRALPRGRNFGDNGVMMTAALNYRF